MGSFVPSGACTHHFNGHFSRLTWVSRFTLIFFSIYCASSWDKPELLISCLVPSTSITVDIVEIILIFKVSECTFVDNQSELVTDSNSSLLSALLILSFRLPGPVHTAGLSRMFLVYLAQVCDLCVHLCFLICLCVSILLCFLGSGVISLTVFGPSVTNLNEPPRALATSTIAWVRQL